MYATDTDLACDQLARRVAARASGRDLAVRLRLAIAAREIEVRYQPVVDLRDGVTVRLEALARWSSYEPAGPGVFVPAAERAGVVAELDLHVLATIVDQVRRWRAVVPCPVVSVNISQRTLTDDDAVRQIVDLIRRTEVDPAWLHVEVTETWQADIGLVAAGIDRLRAAGLGVSLDDFGTRFSFLQHLLVSSADELKIDRLFIRSLPDSRATAILRSIVGLAHELGLRVVAEGIETDDQLDHARAAGCDLAQGFFFAPALDAERAFARATEQRSAIPFPSIAVDG